MSNVPQTIKDIYTQMGGNRFLVMTGAKNLVYEGETTLRFHIGRNRSKTRYVTISLNSLDLYDMKFTYLNRKQGLITVAEYENIGCESLRSIFTQVTGLFTHL